MYEKVLAGGMSVEEMTTEEVAVLMSAMILEGDIIKFVIFYPETSKSWIFREEDNETGTSLECATEVQQHRMKCGDKEIITANVDRVDGKLDRVYCVEFPHKKVGDGYDDDYIIRWDVPPNKDAEEAMRDMLQSALR